MAKEDNKNRKKKVVKKEEVKELTKKEEKKDKNIKEEKKNKKKNDDKMLAFLDFFDKYRYLIYGILTGTLVTVIVVIIIWPDRIAKLKDGTEPVVDIDGYTLTADALYENLKSSSSIDSLLSIIDKEILEKKYPKTDEIEKEVQEEAENYYNMYQQYGMDKASFLSNSGFNNESEFLDFLRLKNRRNKYYDEYVKSQITEKEINDFYETKVFGDINTKHILVPANSDASEEEQAEAKKLAEEIISKLNSGKTFDEVKEEYKDSITYEELGYKSYNANLESAYLEEMQKLANDSYSKIPVKTSYGYHIVYRIDQKEKPKLDDIKDEIIESIAKSKKDADSNLYYKSLDKMRNDANMKFSDTVMEGKYKEYMEKYK